MQASQEKCTAVWYEINKYIGVPYIWGGNNPKGFDCSGLVQWTIKKTHGIQIPRTTKLQSLKWKEQLNLILNQIKVGDLIYFKTSQENKIHGCSKFDTTTFGFVVNSWQQHSFRYLAGQFEFGATVD